MVSLVCFRYCSCILFSGGLLQGAGGLTCVTYMFRQESQVSSPHAATQHLRQAGV